MSLWLILALAVVGYLALVVPFAVTVGMRTHDHQAGELPGRKGDR